MQWCLSADIRPKSTVDVGELSKGIEDIKESLEIIKSWPTCNPSPLQLEAKYSSVVKSSSDKYQELRLSGMPDISMSTDSKFDKSNNFEHDEKMISDSMKFLGANVEEISSFRRHGNFNATKKRPRQMLVKFRNVITADRIFAHATMLKNYEPNIKGNKYSIFLSKSSNKEDQERERNLLKKRRKDANYSKAETKQKI